MKRTRIKSDWASIYLTDTDNVIICYQKDKPTCLCFNSIASFKKSLIAKQVLVKNWAFMVPRDLCIVKTISLPASSLEEAAKMIEFELPSLVPLTIDQLVYGCTYVMEKEGILSLNVYILKRILLDKYLEPYRNLGIIASHILVDTLALEEWVISQSCHPARSIYSFCDSKHFIILSLLNDHIQELDEHKYSDKSSQECSFDAIGHLERHISKLDHCINKESFTILLEGPQQFIESIEKKHASKAWDHSIKHINSPPYIVNPCDSSDITSPSLSQIDVSLTLGLYTLATSNRHPFANLLPADYLRKQRERRRLLNLSLTASLIFAVILFSWTTLFAMNWHLSQKSKKIEAQIKPFAEIAHDVSTKRSLVTAIKQIDTRRGRISEIIKELDRYTDNTSITISNLVYEIHSTDSLVSATGQADNIDVVLNLPNRVQNSRFLTGLGWSYIGPKSNRVDEGRGIEFKLKCRTKD